MAKDRNAYLVLVWKPERKREYLEDLSVDDGASWSFYKTWGSINIGEFLQLTKYLYVLWYREVTRYRKLSGSFFQTK
jgi:hypothetical protein